MLLSIPCLSGNYLSKSILNLNIKVSLFYKDFIKSISFQQGSYQPEAVILKSLKLLKLKLPIFFFIPTGP